jgi:hypothetical protein
MPHNPPKATRASSGSSARSRVYYVSKKKLTHITDPKSGMIVDSNIRASSKRPGQGRYVGESLGGMKKWRNDQRIASASSTPGLWQLPKDTKITPKVPKKKVPSLQKLAAMKLPVGAHPKNIGRSSASLKKKVGDVNVTK